MCFTCWSLRSGHFLWNQQRQRCREGVLFGTVGSCRPMPWTQGRVPSFHDLDFVALFIEQRSKINRESRRPTTIIVENTECEINTHEIAHHEPGDEESELHGSSIARMHAKYPSLKKSLTTTSSTESSQHGDGSLPVCHNLSAGGKRLFSST